MAYDGRVKDLVIMLPGIMGSVLQKDGKDLWALSGRAIWRVLRDMDEVWEQLTIQQDDPLADDLGDGIVASSVIQDAHVVPGLIKIDGYTELRELFVRRLRMIDGDINNDKPANYFDFPYDWRRDNRASAHKLKKIIDRKLAIWRDYSEISDAQVILVAHSMGGLVSRYYLEKLEGWRTCKALVTFGTPYRGSLDAVQFLAHGYKDRWPSFTNMARSLESLHQLLPIYKMVKDGNSYKRVSEVSFLPGSVPGRTKAGREFHKEIWEAVDEHDAVDYEDNGYELVPIVGIQQDTPQTVEFANGQVTLSETPPNPNWVGNGIADGDGTVPRISAIPLEQSRKFNGRFAASKHSALQTNKDMLNQLFEIISWTQADALGDVRGDEDEYEGRDMALSLSMDDLYFPEEPVILRAKAHNMGDPGKMTLTLSPLAPGSDPLSITLDESDGVWSTTVGDLAPGMYRATLDCEKEGPYPIYDVFEVAGE